MHDVRINRQAIQSLVNSTGRTKKFLWDREVPGFGVYKTASGLPTFVYQFRSPLDKAVVRRDTLGCYGELTVEQARDLARDRGHQRRLGIDPVLARREAANAERLADELMLPKYIEGLIKRRAADQRPFREPIKTILRKDIAGTLGEVRLDRISYKIADDAATELAKRSFSAKRWFIVYLKVIINDAIARGLLTNSPVSKIPTPKPNERDRVLTHFEIQRFLEAARDMCNLRGDAHELLLRLARRKEEIAAISWEEIDQHNCTWALPGHREKTRTPLRLKLPANVMRIFEKQQPKVDLRTGHIFSLTDGATSATVSHDARVIHNAYMDRRCELFAIANGTARPVVPHFTIHDLRTTAATIMGEELDVEPHIIEVLLNHKLGNKMQRKYQRSTFGRQMDAALIKWNEYLDQLLAKPNAWPGGKVLPTMDMEEIKRRHATFTADWPKRANSKNDEDGTD